MKKLYFILLLIGPNLTFGQSYKLPDVIPPSPQAGEFIKYTDFPMDLSSGLPSINIPIYTVKSEELSVPISLSYHASGLKPNEDESGIIGLGWHLNAFGIISRTINKRPDEDFWNYLIPLAHEITPTIENNRNPDSDILDEIVEGYFAESTPDIFNYTLPNGGSGKFLFKRSTDSNEFLDPVVLPFKPVKIVPSGLSLNYFEIKDESGVLYRFGESISTNQEITEKYISYDDYANNGITSWLLTEIISADKSDTIYFEYDDVLNSEGETGIFKSRHTFISSATIKQSDPGIEEFRYDSGITDAWTGYVYSQKKITKMRFKSGYVNFIYKSNVYPNHLLDRIEVYSKGSGVPVKTIKFLQTKYHSSPDLLNWYKLDELKFYDMNNTNVNGYQFLYNSSNFPRIDYGGIQTYAVDFWGYYNGALNDNLMPSFDWTCPFPYGYNLFGSANRDPNSDFSKAGVLTKIINPTGGETIYEYEGNMNNSNEAVGGIRVRSITHRTNEKEIKRSFDYWGISKRIDSTYFVKHNASGDLYAVTDVFTASAEPNCDININGNPVLYTKVIEYLGDEIINTGRIEHTFDGAIADSFVDINYLHYPSHDRAYPWVVESAKYSYGPLLEYYNDVVPANILEKETKVFDASGNAVRTTRNYYSHTLKEAVNGLNVTRVFTVPDDQKFLEDRTWFYNFYNYKIKQLSQKLDSIVTTEYLAGTPLTTRQKYTYNNDQQITEKKRQKSDGSWIISEYRYPGDFSSQAPYDDMVNNHIISPVIEQLDYQGTIPLQFIKINYQDWGDNVIAPVSVEAKAGANPYETRMRYHSYDNAGNFLSVSKDGGTRESYIWGYKQSYPIAKAGNATENQIAFTSFENPVDQGGWSYIHNASSEKKTGNYSFQGASVNKSNLPSEYYSVGYWVMKSGTSNCTITVNGSPSTISNSSWEFREFNTSSAVTNISINLSGVYIDELRLHPKDAQITTYTYDPLIGMTSQTDPNGLTTYYKYDDFGRLKLIKDHEGNILKKYSYQYKVE